ncbi:hypothetical protein V8E36_006973 [Tilletia maclaganii]
MAILRQPGLQTGQDAAEVRGRGQPEPGFVKSTSPLVSTSTISLPVAAHPAHCGPLPTAAQPEAIPRRTTSGPCISSANDLTPSRPQRERPRPQRGCSPPARLLAASAHPPRRSVDLSSGLGGVTGGATLPIASGTTTPPGVSGALPAVSKQGKPRPQSEVLAPPTPSLITAQGTDLPGRQADVPAALASRPQPPSRPAQRPQRRPSRLPSLLLHHLAPPSSARSAAPPVGRAPPAPSRASPALPSRPTTSAPPPAPTPLPPSAAAFKAPPPMRAPAPPLTAATREWTISPPSTPISAFSRSRGSPTSRRGAIESAAIKADGSDHHDPLRFAELRAAEPLILCGSARLDRTKRSSRRHARSELPLAVALIHP